MADMAIPGKPRSAKKESMHTHAGRPLHSPVTFEILERVTHNIDAQSQTPLITMTTHRLPLA